MGNMLHLALMSHVLCAQQHWEVMPFSRSTRYSTAIMVSWHHTVVVPHSYQAKIMSFLQPHNACLIFLACMVWGWVCVVVVDGGTCKLEQSTHAQTAASLAFSSPYFCVPCKQPLNCNFKMYFWLFTRCRCALLEVWYPRTRDNSKCNCITSDDPFKLGILFKKELVNR